MALCQLPPKPNPQPHPSRPVASGRRRPVPVAGSEFIIPCDAVIPAIGQKVDLSWQDGALVEATISADLKNKGLLVYQDKRISLDLEEGESFLMTP